MIQSIGQLNDKLISNVPGYKTINDSVVSLYTCSLSQLQTMSEVANKQYKRITKFTSSLTNGFVENVYERTDDILSKVQSLIKIQKCQELASKDTLFKDRLIIIFVKLNKLAFKCAENVKQYGLQLIKNGKKLVYTIYLPIYIPLKATIVVTKEMLVEMLQKRLSNMKVTYEASKNNVTMIISGKFNQEKIKEVIAKALKKFKQKTIKIANKGLEINVDRESLIENYDTFSLKFIEVVKNMRQLGAENIVSIKEKSKNLYREIINRIKEKQIEIRTSYQTKKTEVSKQQPFQQA